MKEEVEIHRRIYGMPDLRETPTRTSYWVGELVGILRFSVPIVASVFAAWLLSILLGLGEEGTVRLCATIGFLASISPMFFFLDTPRPSDTHRAHVLIGTDGVLLCQAWSKHPNEPPKEDHRFLPYSAIKQIDTFYESGEVNWEGVDLTLTSGQGFHLTVADETAKDLCLRLCEAQKRCKETVCEYEQFFRRGNRSVEEWLNALNMLKDSSHQGYRSPSLGSTQCWLVIEASSANPTARAGAAMVLLKRAGFVDRERLLDAAKSAVAPGLSAAFVAIANSSSDEVLVNALAAVEELGDADSGADTGTDTAAAAEAQAEAEPEASYRGPPPKIATP